ncbi:hypothetical protein Ae201684_004024 [Aphanomyces euteiches]|uniref:RanBP2-type domain-containing protein n=1 Tax=Aphanomyces euteiches TaxID=100861 RepID=A0A6G0XK15_9STRA|nr:hypothetical protein Ae201684_004024 [Aphanomyces euteiches]KAH9156230.1 hypothetical protein AeRB84_001861 [Aphanomyces euteiches]
MAATSLISLTLKPWTFAGRSRFVRCISLSSFIGKCLGEMLPKSYDGMPVACGDSMAQFVPSIGRFRVELWQAAILLLTAVVTVNVMKGATEGSKMTGQQGWACHLCTKINGDKVGSCVCCGRPRNYAAKSIGNLAKTKGLVLHADLSAVTRPEQVAEMIRGGMNPNETSMDGFAPLHCAALHGQAGIVRELLKQGADKELPAPDGKRPLHFAVESGNLQAVQELLSWKVDVNARTTGDSWTPLHVASSLGFAAITDLLLRSGGNPMLSTTHMQQTALHFAAERGHVDVVQVLLQHTDMDLVACVDRSGATAIQIAQLANQTVVFELLHLRMGDSVLHDRMLDHLLVSASSS